MTRWPESFSVEGDHVRVVPLTMEHEADLREATADGELHKLWYTSVPSPEGVADEIARRLSRQGFALPEGLGQGIEVANDGPLGRTVETVLARLQAGKV